MRVYSFYDIPHTMLSCVKIIIKKKEDALIILKGASSIKKQVNRLVKRNNKISVLFL